MEYPCGLLCMYIKNYCMEAVLVTTLADKNVITVLRTIFVLNMTELSNITLVDLAWLN